MFRSFQDIIEAVQNGRPKTIAVAMAQEPEILKAVDDARKMGLAQGILVGSPGAIAAAAKEAAVELEGFEVLPEDNSARTAIRGVELVQEGKAEMLMKGLVGTADLLRAVLDKERGLRTDGILSHVAVFEAPGYQRLFFLTDAAMNIAPDLKRKGEIVRNAAEVARSLGIEKPRVAPLCAVEVVNPEMPATTDAALLAKMGDRGQLGQVEVDGPLALDNAVSATAATRKGLGGEVVGQADILLVPNIEAGNIFYKALNYFCPGVKIAGIIAGAKAPVVLTSRADSHETKLLSIALGLLHCG